MTRFSPQRVRTGTQPSDLAAALQGAVSGYQGQRDRQEADLAREFAQNLQRGQALRQGITLDTPPEPETFGSAFAKAYRPVPEAPAGPPVAGGYDPTMKDFQRIDPVTKAPVLPTMRSGGATYDPNVDIRQEMATARGKGELGLEMGQKGRSIRQKELEQALATVPGAPMGAAASEGASSDWLGRPPSAPPLRLGDPGYVDALSEAERAKRAAAGAGGDRVTAQARNTAMSIEKSRPLLDRAIALARENPDAFGLRNMFGPLVVDRADRMFKGSESANRMIGTRSAMENIVSELRHELYGAALTRPEIQRALLNLPDVKQDPEGVLVRLMELKAVLDAQENALQTTNAMYGARTQAAPNPSSLVNEFESRFGRPE